MNKKGFTLIELLAVITVLSILMILVIPNVTNINSSTRNKTYDTKIKLIEKAAVMYGQDNPNSISSSGTNVTVSTLITKGYLETDNMDTTTSKCGNKCIADPRDTSKYLDNQTITIKSDSNGKVTAKYNGN